MPTNLENSAVATGLEKVSFHSNPKFLSAMPKNVQTTAQLHSHTSKVWLKILQARLQQYVNSELLDVQAGFRKDQIAHIHWIIKEGGKFQKTKQNKKPHIFLLYCLHESFWLCESQQMVENSERDGNTKPPNLPPEKSVCRSGSNG